MEDKIIEFKNKQFAKFIEEFNIRKNLLIELKNSFNDSLEEHYKGLEEFIIAAYIFEIIGSENYDDFLEKIDEIYYSPIVIFQL